MQDPAAAPAQQAGGAPARIANPHLPIIGIVPSAELEENRLVLRNPYIDAITSCGGAPVILPLTADKRVYESLFPLMDGFLLTGGAELLAVTLLGELPAVAAVFDRLGLGLFSRVDFTAGYTLQSTAILAYICMVVTVGGYLLLAKAVEYTSATEASFIYLFKPIVAALFSAVLLHETISPNRIVGIGFFTAASVTAILPVFLEMRRGQQGGTRP